MIFPISSTLDSIEALFTADGHLDMELPWPNLCDDDAALAGVAAFGTGRTLQRENARRITAGAGEVDLHVAAGDRDALHLGRLWGRGVQGFDPHIVDQPECDRSRIGVG